MSRNPIAPGNHDKAWNDPPQLSFSASNRPSANQETCSRLRLMKKRVPIPINTTPSLATPHEKIGFPPSVSAPPQGKCLDLRIHDNQIKDVEEIPKDKGILDELQHIMDDVLATLPDDNAEISTKDDVTKRLEILRSMWHKDQLQTEVKQQMTKLIEALQRNDYNKAWSIHQNLIVNYTRDCSSWITGIKLLISEARNKQVERKGVEESTDLEISTDGVQFPMFMNPSNVDSSM